MQFLFTLVSAIAALSVASAKPITIKRAETVSDIVVTPAFIRPAGGESYAAGSKQAAEWETDSIPPEAQNYTGSLYLGYSDGKTDDEHLDIRHPLAVGFKLTDGEVSYQFPSNVTAGDSYFLVLFGDSGNTSQKFSITV